MSYMQTTITKLNRLGAEFQEQLGVTTKLTIDKMISTFNNHDLVYTPSKYQLIADGESALNAKGNLFAMDGAQWDFTGAYGLGYGASSSYSKITLNDGYITFACKTNTSYKHDANLLLNNFNLYQMLQMGYTKLHIIGRWSNYSTVGVGIVKTGKATSDNVGWNWNQKPLNTAINSAYTSFGNHFCIIPNYTLATSSFTNNEDNSSIDWIENIYDLNILYNGATQASKSDIMGSTGQDAAILTIMFITTTTNAATTTGDIKDIYLT